MVSWPFLKCSAQNCVQLQICKSKILHNSTKEINSADLEADNVMGSRLTTLCLGDNQFTGEIYARALEVAVRVDVLIHLKSLDLSNALTYNMDTNGVLLTTLLPCLASHCPSLATLDLSKNNLGVPGARPLGETFPLFTTSRKEFTLHLTKANFDSAALLVFCEAIKLSSIEEVPFSTENYDIENVMYLNQNPLNYDTLLAMFSALRCRSCQITTLYLNNTDYTTMSGTKGILPSIDADGMSSCLTTLHLNDNHFSGEAHINALEEAVRADILVNLKKLYLSNTLTINSKKNGELLSRLLPSIVQNSPKLKILDISDNNLGVPGACALGKVLPALISSRDEFDLDLCNTDLDSQAMTAFTQEAIDGLSLLTTPPPANSKLQLNDNPIGYPGLFALFKLLNTKNCAITDLSLTNTALYIPAIENGFQYVNNLTTSIDATVVSNLRILNLGDNRFCGVTYIRMLEVAIQSGMLIYLEDLDLTNTFPNDSDINGALLASILPTIASSCPYLLSLDLSHNNFGVPGAYAIGKALPMLTIANISLVDTYLFSEAIKAFSNGFASTSCFACNLCNCTVDLSENSIGSDILPALLSVIEDKSCPIIILDLNLTNSKNQCVQKVRQPKVSSEISNNRGLITVDLRRNNLHGDNIFVLAEFLSLCQSLEKLQCTDCYITSTDVSNLFSQMKLSSIKHNTLKEWDLQDNLVGNKGIDIFLENLLDLFPGLEQIKLDGNPAKYEPKKKLEEFLKRGKKSSQSHHAGISDSEADGKMEQDLTKKEGLMWDDLLEEMIQHFKKLNEENNVQSCNSESDKTFPSPVISDNSDSHLSATDEPDSLLEEMDTEEAIVQRMDKLEIHIRSRESPPVKIDKLTGVTASPVTTPSPHRSPSGSGGLRTLIIEELKERTKVTDSQLDEQIQQKDMFKLSAYFGSVEDYINYLELTPSQQTDIKDLALRRSTQTAMTEVLKLWREHNPYTATYRSLLELLLDMGKGEVASQVCYYLSSKCQHTYM